MGLILLSLIFNGCLFVSEEFLFGKFLLHPFQVVGTEGFWGICLYSITIPILSNTHCDRSSFQELCISYPKTSNSASGDPADFESPSLYMA